MGKTLILRRHSIKDGPNNTLGSKGIELAQLEGDKMMRATENLDTVFHGPLLRTAQTTLSFALGYGECFTLRLHPVIYGMGSDELFAEMVTTAFKAAVGDGQNHVQALITAHGLDKVLEWAEECLRAVKEMFYVLKDGETGVGFFHSPTVQLATWAAIGFGSDFTNDDCVLGDLEGFELYLDDKGDVLIERKIQVEPTGY